MSRSSCVSQPSDEPLVVIKKWQIEVCGGDVCAAALLSFFEYWHNFKIDQVKKSKQANKVAITHGFKEDAIHDETLYQYHTEKELHDGIMELYSRQAIRDAIKLLIEKNFISVHKNPNPRYVFDKTRFFVFKPDMVNDAIRSIRPKMKYVENNESQDVVSDPKAENGSRSAENGLPSAETGRSITETTSETTTETTTETTKETRNPTASESLLMEEWNSLGDPFPKVLTFNTTRKKTLKTRLSDPWWRDNWQKAIKAIPKSSFLKGEKGWIAGIDWFLRPDSATKILEGAYNGGGQQTIFGQKSPRVLETSDQFKKDVLERS